MEPGEARPAFQPPSPEQTAIRRGQAFPDPALRGTDVGDRQQQQLELVQRLIAQGIDPEEAQQRAFGGGTFTRGETVTPAGQLALTRGEDLQPSQLTPPGTVPDVVGQPPFGVREVERARTRFTAPIAALGLQVGESPIGSTIPGVVGLKAIQAGAGPTAEFLGGVDAGIQGDIARFGAQALEATLPRERTFDEAFEGGVVNPFKAFEGDEAEQEKALAVLEEAGFARSLAAEILFDPFNVFPGLGVTKVRDVAQFGRLVVRATKAAPSVRAAAVQALKESDLVRTALRGIREAPEAGARPLRGGEGVPRREPTQVTVTNRKTGETRTVSVDETGQAFRDMEAGVPPPREPLPPSDLPPPLEVPPSRGQAGAEALLSTKEETLLRPGPVTKFPGIKQAASGLNPSVTTDREILVAYNARQAAAASLETEFAAARQSPLDELRAIFRDDPPRYTGPEDNPFKNTLKDWGDNPEHYVLTEGHLAAARAYDDVGNQTLARASGEFGVKVEPFPVKEGGFFTPTVATKESLEAAVKNVSDGYTSASITGKGARTKTRVFEGAYQRWLNNADFRAETDLAELTGLHDRAMSTLAGNQTFKIGSGGLSRIEVSDLLHSGLREARDSATRTMTNLRRRIDTAIRQIKQSGTAGRRLDAAVAQAEKRARPILDRIDDLGEEFGPELSFLSGEARQVTARAEALRTISVKTRGKGAASTARLKELQAEVRKLEPELEKLRRGYEVANLEPYVLNRQTFQFHLPEQSEAIDSILRTKLNIGQGFADVIDEVRLTAFAADVSPLTIQGLLGGLSHPLITASNTRNIVRSLWNPDELLKIATREPELVERFTVATGRPFGEVGPEFVQKFKGIERARIPFTDLRPGRALNRRLMAAVEEIRYSAWKTDQDLIRKFNPEMTQNVADAEAANFLSKMIPALNPAETGRSVLRARFERIPIISTSFLSAPPALLKDMASGLAKLGLNTKLSPIARWQLLSGREQLSLLRGLNLAGSISALTVGSYVASGFSIEDAVKKTLDPTGNNPRFLSIALGKDRFIPIGGPVRSFVRGIIPEKVGEVKGVPLYLPFVNTKKWLLGKVTPAIKAPIDIARDKDFFGGNIATGSFPENILRAVWYGVNSILPLSVAEPSEAIRRGEIEPTDFAEIGIRGGGQFAGSDVRELRLREAFERETGRSFAETPSALRRQIIADSPLLTRLAEQQEVFFPDEGKRIRAERSTELLPHAQAALGGGLEAVRAYNDNRKFIMAKFGGVSEEVFKDLDIEPKGRDNELLSQYYEVDFRADHNGNGIPGDDEDVRLALEEQDNLKSQMSPAVQAALNNPENFFVDREVIEYEGILREGVDAIRDILNLPKWTGLTLEEGNTLDDLVSRINADVQRYKAQAVREGDSADSVTFRNTAEWLRDRGAISALDAENAIAVSSGIAIREQGRIDLALDRRDVLLQTFPDFFGSVLPAEVEREQLTGEEIEQLQPAGIP